MSYGNRSKEYDWFKGKNSKENKSPKETFKLIWKFTKIFLMFSLFFFSMWGCVQVFIIKTDNHVGNGVEFYNSESEVSPYVRQIKITKTGQSPNEIYSLEDETSKNIWLNEHNLEKELRSVQSVLKDGTQGQDTHQMTDVIKGRNDYLRIIGPDGSVSDSDQIAAMSSQQDVYRGTANAWTPSPITLYKITGKTIVAETYNPIPIATTGLSDIAKSRLKYSYAILGAIDHSFKKQGATKLVFTDSSIQTTDTNAVVLAQNHNAAVSLAFSLANGSFDGTTHTYRVSPSVFGGETNYRPIITWGQAWERGVGPFYGLFVWPISKLSVAITSGIGLSNGWESLISIIVIVFILRLLAFGITFKSVLQQTKQQELQGKKAIIDAKYANYKGNKQMEARKRQETADLYKKEGVSPLGSIGSIFITMPIFLSIWRVIGGVPHLKSTVWLGVNFSATSYKELFAGEWQYLPLILFAGFFAAFSQIFPRLLTKRREKDRKINVHQKAAMKKNNKTQNIVMVVYVIMSLIFSAGIQVYWIVGGIWQIIQTTITHHVIIQHSKRKKKMKVKI